MMTDPLGDMLTRIRNASRVMHAQTRCPSSKLKVAVAEVLLKEGFISGVSVEENDKKADLVMDLRYDGCLLYTSPSPRDATLSRMPSSA